MFYAPVNRIQIAACLIGTVDACKFLYDHADSDFARHNVTETLFKLHMAGMGVLVLALMIGFTHPRRVPLLGLVAAVLTLPTWLYVLAPGPFQLLVTMEYEDPATAWITLDPGALLGIFSCVLLACLWLNSLFPQKIVVETKGGWYAE